jgi:formyltetrahydrofolate hydrolase
MQFTITAVGPDHSGLADPIVHYVTGHGGNIAEIQMYDHDRERLFAMLLRVHLAAEQEKALREAMADAAAGPVRDLAPGAAAGAIAGDPRRAAGGRAGAGDRQSSELPGDC